MDLAGGGISGALLKEHQVAVIDSEPLRDVSSYHAPYSRNMKMYFPL
jgi:hypothetical protein